MTGTIASCEAGRNLHNKHFLQSALYFLQIGQACAMLIQSTFSPREARRRIPWLAVQQFHVGLVASDIETVHETVT